MIAPGTDWELILAILRVARPTRHDSFCRCRIAAVDDARELPRVRCQPQSAARGATPILLYLVPRRASESVVDSVGRVTRRLTPWQVNPWTSTSVFPRSSQPRVDPIQGDAVQIGEENGFEE